MVQARVYTKESKPKVVLINKMNHCELLSCSENSTKNQSCRSGGKVYFFRELSVDRHPFFFFACIKVTSNNLLPQGAFYFPGLVKG